MSARYDAIGANYARYRVPDRRIANAVENALGLAASVANIGAGAGSYEPRGRSVVAVEPSLTMIRQRPRGSAPVVQAIAESLPFRDATFDAALAMLTVHHWPDPAAGLREMQRVAPLQVLLTWDPVVTAKFWLIADYLPQLAIIEQDLPTVGFIAKELTAADVRPVMVPWNCSDGFLGAYWRRPELYLDADRRGAISALSLMDPGTVSAGMRALERDLASGGWAKRHGDLAGLDELDLGYRLIVARSR